MTAKPSRYDGSRVALLTQHGKERVIASVLKPGLGCLIELVTGFDTDRFDTFTRETPRDGTQLEAARRKARKGMELAGASLGIASEGSFGPDPYTGMFPWNRESVVLIISQGRHRSPAPFPMEAGLGCLSCATPREICASTESTVKN